MIREQQRFRQSRAYQSYLVRLWQSNDGGCWRASAQCVQNGHTILFGDIEQLLAFLQRQVSHPPPLAPNAETPVGTGDRFLPPPNLPKSGGGTEALSTSGPLPPQPGEGWGGVAKKLPPKDAGTPAGTGDS